MVEHVVLFRLKPDASEALKTGLMRSLVGLKDLIPGIVHASAGPNFSARAQGYTHGLVIRFTDKAALDAYLTHPAHVEVVEKQVRPISEGVLALDYSFS